MAAAHDLTPPPADDPYPEAGPPYAPASAEEEAAFLAAVEQGIASADAGRVIPWKDVNDWLLSWEKGTPKPRPKA
jgi:hypothetical protein